MARNIFESDEFSRTKIPKEDEGKRNVFANEDSPYQVKRKDEEDRAEKRNFLAKAFPTTTLVANVSGDPKQASTKVTIPNQEQKVTKEPTPYSGTSRRILGRENYSGVFGKIQTALQTVLGKHELGEDGELKYVSGADVAMRVANTEGGKKFIAGATDKVSDLTLKATAVVKSTLGKEADKTYQEVLTRLKEKRMSPDQSSIDKALFEVGGVADSTLTSLIGLAATFGASRINPALGTAVGTSFWTTLSAGEQIEKKGEVYSKFNIAVDTVGDMILGSVLSKMFMSSTSTWRKQITAAGVETSTEYIQTLSKYANDYRMAESPEEREKVLQEAKDFHTSGDVLRMIASSVLTSGIATGAVTYGESVVQGAEYGVGATMAGIQNVPKPEISVGNTKKEPEVDEPEGTSQTTDISTQDVQGETQTVETSKGTKTQETAVVEPPVDTSNIAQNSAQVVQKLASLDAKLNAIDKGGVNSNDIGTPRKDVIAEMNQMRASFVEFANATKETPVQIGNPKGNMNAVVDVLPLSDGTYLYRASVSTSQGGMGMPFDLHDVSQSREEAIAKGVQTIKTYAKKYTTTNKTEEGEIKRILQELGDRFDPETQTDDIPMNEVDDSVKKLTEMVDSLMTPEEAMTRTVREVNMRWDVPNAFFSESIQAPLRANIELLKERLSVMTGKKNRAQKGKIERMIAENEKRMADAREIIENENMAFQDKLQELMLAQATGMQGDNVAEDLMNAIYEEPINIPFYDNTVTELVQSFVAERGGVVEQEKVEETKKTEEQVVETDEARRQEIQNSINEGELILKDGKKTDGTKLSDEEKKMVEKSLESAKKKLGNEETASKLTKSRFATAQEMLLAIGKPKNGEQGLTLNEDEISQLLEYMSSIENPALTMERGIVYKPYGGKENEADIILGMTDFDRGRLESGKVVAEVFKDKTGTWKSNGRFRIHGTPLEKKNIITTLTGDSLVGLAPGAQKTNSKTEQVEEKAEAEPKAENYENDIPLETAVRSFDGISFDSDKRGASARKDYAEEIIEMRKKFEEKAVTDEQKKILDDMIEAYRQKRKELYLDWLRAQGRTMSTMITGAGNFPVERNRKRMQAASNKLSAIIAHTEQTESRIKRALEKQEVQDAGGATVVAKTKLEKQNELLEAMKEANNIVKNKKLTDEQKVEQIAKLPQHNEATAKELLKPDFAGRLGYPSFQLTSVRGKIKRLAEEVSLRESREKRKQEGDKDFVMDKELYVHTDGTRVVVNEADDRVRIYFPGKPDEAMRSNLKSHGWKWSPNAGAWQRKNTPDARYSVSRFIFPEMKEAMVSKKKESTTEKEEPTSQDDGVQVFDKKIFNPEGTFTFGKVFKKYQAQLEGSDFWGTNFVVFKGKNTPQKFNATIEKPDYAFEDLAGDTKYDHKAKFVRMQKFVRPPSLTTTQKKTLDENHSAQIELEYTNKNGEQTTTLVDADYLEQAMRFVGGADNLYINDSREALPKVIIVKDGKRVAMVAPLGEVAKTDKSIKTFVEEIGGSVVDFHPTSTKAKAKSGKVNTKKRPIVAEDVRKQEGLLYIVGADETKMVDKARYVNIEGEDVEVTSPIIKKKDAEFLTGKDKSITFTVETVNGKKMLVETTDTRRTAVYPSAFGLSDAKLDEGMQVTMTKEDLKKGKEYRLKNSSGDTLGFYIRDDVGRFAKKDPKSIAYDPKKHERVFVDYKPDAKGREDITEQDMVDFEKELGKKNTKLEGEHWIYAIPKGQLSVYEDLIDTRRSGYKDATGSRDVYGNGIWHITASPYQQLIEGGAIYKGEVHTSILDTLKENAEYRAQELKNGEVEKNPQSLNGLSVGDAVKITQKNGLGEPNYAIISGFKTSKSKIDGKVMQFVTAFPEKAPLFGSAQYSFEQKNFEKVLLTKKQRQAIEQTKKEMEEVRQRSLIVNDNDDRKGGAVGFSFKQEASLQAEQDLQTVSDIVDREANGEKVSFPDPKPEAGLLGRSTKAITGKITAKRAQQEARKVIKRSEIADALSRAIGAPIKRGKFRQRALGIFKPNANTVRVRERNSGGLPTIFHEMGHAIDYMVQPMGGLIPSTELKPLTSEYGGALKTKKRLREEAFAEFMRFYMSEPAKAKHKAPVFYDIFEREMQKVPEVYEVIQEAKRDWARWNEQEASAKVLSHISFEDKDARSVGEKVHGFLDRLYEQAVNDLHPVAKYSELAKKTLGRELSVDDDPYILARLSRGWVGKAETFLEHGTFGKIFWKTENGKTKPVFTGKSLRDILGSIEKKGAMDDFRVYIIAKRAVELHGRRIETGMSPNVARQAVAEQEAKHPDFSQKQQELVAFQDRVLEYAHQQGLMDKKAMIQMREMNKDYVPFFRVHEEMTNAYMSGKKGFGNTTSGIKKIRGSEREILDPLESVVKNTYSLINAAERNAVAVALYNSSKKSPVLGQMVEIVPVSQAKVATVSGKEIVKKAFGGDLDRMFLETEVQEALETMDETLLDIFRPAMFEKGTTVTVMIDGKRRAMELDPDLHRSLQALDVEGVGVFVKILSYPAKFLRAGAVLSPDFMLRNPIRDQMTAFTYSKYGYLPMVDLAKGMFSLFNKDDAYKLWKMAGGEHSMLVSLDRPDLQKKAQEVASGKLDRTLNIMRNPLEVLQVLSSYTEAGTRIGEMKLGLKKGKDPRTTAFASREVSLDFARIGSKSKAWNMITAFYNPVVQGNDKLVRSFMDNPYRTTGKMMIGITLPSIILYMLNRDEDGWDEIPQWQKDLFWLVKVGETWYRIPKPFEVGVLFGSVPERIMEYMDTKDPKMLKETANAFREAVVPPIIPTAIMPWFENWANKSYFLDRPIVPISEQDMPNADQYTDQTSEVSKKLGELINYSPAKIDNLLYGYFATLGRYGVDAIDAVIKGTSAENTIPEPAKVPSDIPVLRSFVVREPIGSQSESVNTFYDKLDSARRAKNKYEELVKEGKYDEAEAYTTQYPEANVAKYYEGVARDLSEMRKVRKYIANDETLTPEEKLERMQEIDKTITTLAHSAINMEIDE